jgi:hypothetical protein
VAEWVSSVRPIVSSFIDGGLGGKFGRVRAHGSFPARSTALHCCPIEACHGAGPSREDKLRGGFLDRRVGRSVRPKRTRSAVRASAWLPKRPQPDGPLHPTRPYMGRGNRIWHLTFKFNIRHIKS